MHRRIGARAHRVTRVTPEQNMSKPHRQCESGVAEGDRQNMNGQPEIITQYRHKGIDARRHGDRHLMDKQKGDDRHWQRRQQIDGGAVPGEKNRAEE